MDAETAERDGFLRGRRALVTASSRNLGAAIATALAHAGALVCIHYHASRDAGETLVRRLAAETGLSKEAIIFLTEELALELGPEVTVNAVAPGQIAESADDIAEFDPTFVERAVRHTPAGRLVTRAEVAAIVAMLCSPAFDMVTGA